MRKKKVDKTKIVLIPTATRYHRKKRIDKKWWKRYNYRCVDLDLTLNRNHRKYDFNLVQKQLSILLNEDGEIMFKGEKYHARGE